MKMTDEPVYRSLRDSFSRNIYMPYCGVTAAPVVICEVKRVSQLACFDSEQPPQDVILHVDESLNVSDENGSSIGSLREILAMCRRCVPILYFDSELQQVSLSVLRMNTISRMRFCACRLQKESFLRTHI